MKKLGLIRGILVILIIVVYYFGYQEYHSYREEKNKYQVSLEYNSEQRNCKQIGATKNYIYVIQVDKFGKPIVGSKWRVTDDSGNVISDFQTNNNGNGGLVGLNNGKYYVEEISVPKGDYKKIEDRYSFIVSDIDHTFKIDTRATSIVILSTDENENPVKGIQYHILNENKEEVITIKSNSQGRAGATNLEAGKYYIQEESKEELIEVNLAIGEVHIERLTYPTEEAE